MRPLALVVADATTLPRIILDACAAAGRPIAGLVRVADEAAALTSDLPVLGGEA